MHLLARGHMLARLSHLQSHPLREAGSHAGLFFHKIHEISLGMHTTFRVDVAYMRVYRAKGYRQLVANIRAAAPGQQQRGNLRLASRQSIALP